jgi:hypothetical protein
VEPFESIFAEVVVVFVTVLCSHKFVFDGASSIFRVRTYKFEKSKGGDVSSLYR